MRQTILTLITFIICSCNSIKDETKTANEAIIKSEKLTQRAADIFTRTTKTRSFFEI